MRDARAAEPIKIGAARAHRPPRRDRRADAPRRRVLGQAGRTPRAACSAGQIELHVEDTAGDPATCVRKAQEVVERDGCHLLFGMTLSSEALAVVPKLAEWNAIFMSSDNGDGRLTGSILRAELLPRQHLRPDGHARRLALAARVEDARTSMRIGMDYAWGHNSIGVFEDEVKKAKKNFVGAVFSPIGTKDFSTYITKIRQSGADACFIVHAGRRQQRVPVAGARVPAAGQGAAADRDRRSDSIRAVGDAALGLVGSIALQLHHRQSGEQGIRRAVAEGIRHRARHVRRRAVAGLPDARRPASRRPAASRPTSCARRWRRSTIDSIKGQVAMRACDHQAVQQGYMVKVVKKEGFTTPIPRDDRHLPGDEITPACNR